MNRTLAKQPRCAACGRLARSGHCVLVLAVLLSSALAGACGAGAADEGPPGGGDGYRGVVLDEPIPKPAFTLTDTDGEPFHFREETEGDVALLFFGFTHCPDVCPVTMSNLAAVLEDLSWEARRQVQVIFVTTDPERDTRERLREWLGNFDPRFVGLRGSAEKVDAIMAGLGLPPAIKQPRAGHGYGVGHTSQVIAFAADGIARVVYPFGTRQVDWAHDLPKLLSHEPGANAAEPARATAHSGGSGDAGSDSG